MIKAIYHKDFKKDFRKLPKGMRERFAEHFLLFLEFPSAGPSRSSAKQLMSPKGESFPILRDHPLIGNLRGKRAFSVGGDIRVVYKFIDKNTILLLRIGSHNQVYGN